MFLPTSLSRFPSPSEIPPPPEKRTSSPSDDGNDGTSNKEPAAPSVKVIGSKSVIGMTTHPNYNRQSIGGRRALNQSASKMHIPQRSLLDSVAHEDNEDRDDEEGHDEQDVLPGVLETGVKYTPKSVVAEGWLHKKGTGNDWLGSTAWKPRWARLMLAKVEGIPVDTPLLLIYWYSTSQIPSTVISLDSTVVVPIDSEDREAWNTFCFNVVYVKGSSRVSRTFSVCAEPERNAWVFSINQVLLDHAKAKSRASSSRCLEDVCPKSPERSSIWSGDQFITSRMKDSYRPPLSPPTSPRSPERRPLPRPDVLMGEAFLL